MLARNNIATKCLGGKIGNTQFTRAMSVLFSVQDSARVITLDRPKKLNALDFGMCSSIFNTLEEYSKSNVASLIILKSSNQPRSFCAGGDVASVANLNLEGNTKKSIELFQSEYSLNYQLATYKRPIVVFMDGITMGGGVGLSIHTPFRIATENTKWAMPETDIGFFPDVGTTFALPRVINFANKNCQMALFLCSTGEIITGADSYVLGLASHYVPHDNLENLQARLGELAANLVDKESRDYFKMVSIAIEEFAAPLPKNYKFKYSVEQLSVIEDCFDITKVNSVKDIIYKLDTYSGSETATKFASEISAKLKIKSPTSIQLAINLLKKNSTEDIQSALTRDLYTASNMCDTGSNQDTSVVEFTQAVKHKLIDKQKTPYDWKVTVDQISNANLSSMTSPRPSMIVSLSKNRSDCTWSQYPHHQLFQLPSESIIRSYIEQKFKTTNFSPEMRQNVLDHFSTYNINFRDKMGVASYYKLICDKVSSTK